MIIRNKHRILAVVILSILLWGCTVKYTASVTDKALQVLKFQEVHRVTRTGHWTLHSSTSVFLCAPEIFDHLLLDYKLPETRQQMHLAFFTALSRAFPAIQASDSVWDVHAALAKAREVKAQVLIVPSLQLVIDNLGTLSDFEKSQIDDSDKIYPLDTSVIRVSLYDVASGALLDVANLDSRGRLFKSRHYTLSRLIDRAAWGYVRELSGQPKG